jgi:hypothetical protein
MPEALVWHDEPDVSALSVSVAVTAPLAVRVPEPPAAELVGGAELGALEDGAADAGGLADDDGAVEAVDEPLELEPHAAQSPATVKTPARRAALPTPEANMISA